MTLPSERYRALRRVRTVLLNWAMLPGPIRKTEFRASIRALLRHYPTDYDLKRIAEACPELLKND